MVTSEKDLYFGVTSDILLSNYAIITFFVLSILLTLVLNGISKNLRPRNVLKTFLTQNMFKIMAGQIIAAMICFCIPWRFVLFGGVLHFSGKINLIFQYNLFFLALIFPFYYLLKLLREQKRIMINKRMS